LADLLSRLPGVDKGDADNENMTLLHPDTFIRLSTTEDPKDEWWELVLCSDFAWHYEVPGKKRIG
jgi:hypothetical protein